jgi:hypothetical protein
MKLSGFVVLCCIGSALAPDVARCEPAELVLRAALPVEGPHEFEPSALLLRADALWTVSDKHDAAVYALRLRDDVAVAEQVVPGDAELVLPGQRRFDAEALAGDKQGPVYIASETLVRVFVREVDDTRWNPVGPELGPIGRAVGLFVRHNAAIEGIAVLGGSTLLVAAERDPRGLIELQPLNRPEVVLVQRMEHSVHPVAPGRGPDFADLAVWRDRVFALSRNQHLVVELRRTTDGRWEEGTAWSFAATENDPRHRYVDRTYGMAEGLAIDDETIFVVLDNNGDTRDADREDTRPLLFLFENPIPR